MNPQEVIISRILQEPELITQVRDNVRPEHFTGPRREIYDEILRLDDKSYRPDLTALSERFDDIHEYMIPGTYDLDYQIKLLLDQYADRRLRESLTTIHSNTTDPWAKLTETKKAIEAIEISYDVKSRTFVDQLSDADQKLHTIQKNGLTGNPTGFKGLDRILHGWNDNDLIIAAGRPGMGKTSFALNTALKAEIPAVLFSLEMDDVQLAERFIFMESGQGESRYLEGTYDQDAHDNALYRLGERSISIEDDCYHISTIETRARVKARKGECSMILVDYLQLVTGDKEGKSREQEVSEVSRRLKRLAKELSVPVIALAQLSRAVEQRGGSKRPQLSDLRESGGIEADADSVLFVYRPEYYGFEQDEEGNSVKGICQIIVAKNRHGPCKDVWLEANLHKYELRDHERQTFKSGDPQFQDGAEGEPTPF